MASGNLHLNLRKQRLQTQISLLIGLPTIPCTNLNVINFLGSELMTYGAPNLMDLVDLLATSNDAAGTTNTLSSTSADWPNPLSPLSPAPSDLTTPAPSPSPLTFPSSKKKLRK